LAALLTAKWPSQEGRLELQRPFALGADGLDERNGHCRNSFVSYWLSAISDQRSANSYQHLALVLADSRKLIADG
jgi:hypothetical protein